MIICFYDKDFKGEKDNAALVVDNSSFSLVRRVVDFDDFKFHRQFTSVEKKILGKYLFYILPLGTFGVKINFLYSN